MRPDRWLRLFSLTLVALLLIQCHNSALAKPQKDAQDDKVTDKAIDKQEEDKISDVASKDLVNRINRLLGAHPVQIGTNYSQESRTSLRSNGKLLIYTQYKATLPSCVATREEFSLKDIDPTTLLILPKNNYLVIIASCRKGRERCVQRFFRDSCNITFKPKDYLNDLNIITSLSQDNANQVSLALGQLVKLNTTNADIEQTYIVNTTGRPSTNSVADDKQPRLNAGKDKLTMDDIEVAKPPAPPKKPTHPADPASVGEQQTEEQTLDSLIQELLKLEKDK